MTEVRIVAAPSGDAAAQVLRIEGEVDLDSAEELGQALERCNGNVILDLAGVSFMDSSGLGTLIRARNRLAAEGGSLSVQAVAPNVRRLFELTGLTEFLAD
ncbi:MAG TPA: STAS domain-containing protein [Acidimicrobiales bacterium]|nr:STAS domain-containing protein [Acidimicrobiales bacterium]